MAVVQSAVGRKTVMIEVGCHAIVTRGEEEGGPHETQLHDWSKYQNDGATSVRREDQADLPELGACPQHISQVIGLRIGI